MARPRQFRLLRPHAAQSRSSRSRSGFVDSSFVVEDFGPSAPIKPGIGFREATLRRGALPMKVWLYLPKKATGKLPLVIVPPAGSTLVAGMDLGDGDRTEHFPYAQAGFAVASFEIDGNVPQNSPDQVVLGGANAVPRSSLRLASMRS